MMNLAQLFEALCGIRPGHANTPLRGVCIDSNQARNNMAYVAISGSQKDGHNYVGDAFHRGARLALVESDLSSLFPTVDIRSGFLPEKFSIPKVPFCLQVESTERALENMARYWREHLNPHVIAMAGIGDISVLRMLITEVFSLRSPSRSWALLPPQSSLDIYMAILDMEKPSDRLVLEFEEGGIAIIPEVMNLALPQIGLIGGCNRCYKGILTQAERSLLQNLPAGALAVIDRDCPAEVEAAGHIVARPVYYGLNPAADFWADNVESLGAEGIRFWMHYRTDEFSLRVPLLGHRSVHNAIQAAAAGLCDGITWQEVAAALRKSSPELRLVTLPTEGGAYIVDDTYGISSESALAVLNLLERIEGRKVAVFGEISGEDDILDGNELIGNRAAEVVQELVAVGEHAYPIAEAARRAGLAAQAIAWVKTAQEAVEHLRERLQKNDVVLVKGSERQSMLSVVTGLEAAA